MGASYVTILGFAALAAVTGLAAAAARARGRGAIAVANRLWGVVVAAVILGGFAAYRLLSASAGERQDLIFGGGIDVVVALGAAIGVALALHHAVAPAARLPQATVRQ
jgi:hypothetical protein